MKKEYDFSKGERGKFFKKDATFNFPIYLTSGNRIFIEEIAKKKKSDLNVIVNDLISKDKLLAEAL